MRSDPHRSKGRIILQSALIGLVAAGACVAVQLLISGETNVAVTSSAAAAAAAAGATIRKRHHASSATPEEPAIDG